MKKNIGLPLSWSVPIGAAVFVLVFALAFQVLSGSGSGQVAGAQSERPMSFWEILWDKFSFWQKSEDADSSNEIDESSESADIEVPGDESELEVENEAGDGAQEPEDSLMRTSSGGGPSTRGASAGNGFFGMSSKSETVDLEAELRETLDDGGQSEFESLEKEENSL